MIFAEDFEDGDLESRPEYQEYLDRQEFAKQITANKEFYYIRLKGPLTGPPEDWSKKNLNNLIKSRRIHDSDGFVYKPLDPKFPKDYCISPAECTLE